MNAPAERPAPLGRVIARQFPLLAVGFVVAALLLLGTDAQPADGRDAWIELRWLLLTYPLISVWLLDHLRRRVPTQISPLLACFLLGFLLRLTMLCLITNWMMDLRPSHGGAWNDDSWWYTIVSRFYAQALTGRDTGISGAILNSEAISRLMSFEVRGMMPNFLMAWSAMILANGFTTLAYMLPWTLLGAFWAVQSYPFLRRETGPLVARVVLVLMLLAPDFVIMSTMPSKDALLGILLIYLVELFRDESRLDVRWLVRRLALLLAVATVRLQLYPLVIVILLFGAARCRLAPRPRRWLTVSFALAVWFAAASGPPPLEALSPSYTINWLGNLVLVPMMFWLTAPASGLDLAMHSIAGQALLWPLIAGLLAISLVLVSRRRALLSPAVWTVLLAYHSAGATQASMNVTAVRFRFAILPWILALAGVAVITARQEPAAVRRRLALLGVAVGLAVLGLNLYLGWPRLLHG